ncbi:ZIP family metal transporter [Actinocorallia longicatena]|uniref:ZIP family zinc transporter n=1 Tax=Actinocorallia longicatena TaxID=111803 RepID=A0ABP6QI29_9ACTN
MAILVACGAFVATLLGGLVAARVSDSLHLVLGLAAGIMLGVVGFDLLPEAFEQAHQTWLGVPAAAVTLVAGFLTVHVVERSLAMHRGHEAEFGAHEHGMQALGTVTGTGLIIHSTLDGVGIGLAFQAGGSVGVAVAIAVIAHDFADGFNTFTVTSLYGSGRARAWTFLFLDAAAPVFGAFLGTVVRIPEDAVGLYLGYFAGFLLYLATSDILPEAHAKHPSRLTLLCTVGGAAAMFLVVGLSHG